MKQVETIPLSFGLKTALAEADKLRARKKGQCEQPGCEKFYSFFNIPVHLTDGRRICSESYTEEFEQHERN